MTHSLRGHRQYLDPNPRLVSARGMVWVKGMKGHRQYIGRCGSAAALRPCGSNQSSLFRGIRPAAAIARRK